MKLYFKMKKMLNLVLFCYTMEVLSLFTLVSEHNEKFFTYLSYF